MNPATKSHGSIWAGLIVITGLLLLLAAVLVSATRKTNCGLRGAAASNLRQIAQASLIYAADHRDRLPKTTDLHAYMVALAQAGILNDPALWVYRLDLLLTTDVAAATVLNPDGTGINDALKDVPIACTVVISGLSVNAEAHTPIAWTRGLQADGTWSKDSPHEGEGGYIVFLGGNITPFIKSLKDHPLRRHDGNGTTTNILEALPPGSRIGEWKPVTAR